MVAFANHFSRNNVIGVGVGDIRCFPVDLDRCTNQLIGDCVPINDAAKNGMFAVKIGRSFERDDKLAGASIARPRHRHA